MSIKTIGRSGQISLGKEHAGKTVQVEEIGDGAWIVKTGEFVPDDERWLHASEVAEPLDEAILWAEENPPRETGVDALKERSDASDDGQARPE